MSKNDQKVSTSLNNIEHFLILASAVTEVTWVSAFAALLCMSIGITIFAIRLKICAITSGIRKHKSIIRRKKKKHDEIVLLAKTKLHSIEVVTSKALIDAYISK